MLPQNTATPGKSVSPLPICGTLKEMPSQASTQAIDTLAQPAKKVPRFYRPELDVLRSLAFLTVFLFHSIKSSSTLNGRYIVRGLTAVAVPIFFTLSAFLITELIFREREATGSVNMRAFYVRRILRIWPLYFLFLGVTCLVGLILPSQRFPLTGVIAYICLVGNWWSGFFGALPLIAGPIWSLAVEEQFYLVWPWLVRRLTPRGVMGCSAALWLASQIGTAVLCIAHVNQGAIWSSTVASFQFFCVGGFLCATFRTHTIRLTAVHRGLLLLCGIAVGGAATYCTAVFTAPLVYWLFLFSQGVAAALSLVSILGLYMPPWTKPLAGLGRISYGAYLFHMGLLHLAVLVVFAVLPIHHGAFAIDWLVALPLTILAAMLSYRYFEMPFLRLKQRFEVVRSRAA